MPNTSPEKGRGSPEPKHRGFRSGAAGARGAAWHKHSGSVPARVCFVSRAQGAAWEGGWLDRPCDCSRSHGWLQVHSVSSWCRPHTRHLTARISVSPPHSPSAWTSPPAEPPEKPRARALTGSPALCTVLPHTVLCGQHQSHHVRAGAWHRAGTRPGTGQIHSQCKVVE